ncbi:putative inorganic phosphate cotransporter isoform X2 [Chelonus insularis]|nr:putative inorganic phosphate cotransporter isoform X2 [Chelonus insularis]
MSVAIIAMKGEEKENGLNSANGGIVLSSFFWGYTLMQIPSGYFAKEWSAKLILGWGVLINGLSCILVPFGNDHGGWRVICAFRVIMGLSQACLLPCVHTLLSKWVPPRERGRLGSLTYSGAQFGTVVSYPISGLLVQYMGWRSVFYFFGVAAICWSIIFILYGSDSPTNPTHSWVLNCCIISEPEKKYIESSSGNKSTIKKNLKTPWGRILSSTPFWALAVAHCGQNWGFWMLLTEMPTYMARVLDFDYEENGLISALPYLTMLLLTFPVSWLSDWIQKKGVSRGLTRKISNSIGHWGPGLALFGLAFVPRNMKTLAVVMLIIAVGLNVGSLCGFQLNHIDLSPNFAGLLMSITNCLASIISILAPLIVGHIVTEESDEFQWRIVFYMSTAIYFLGNLVFIILGSGEVQKWDDPFLNTGSIELSGKISTVSADVTATF